MPNSKIPRIAVIVVNIALCFLLLGYLAEIISHPYFGIAVAAEEGDWVVTYCDRFGEGYRLGIRNGDVILSIDNLNPEDFPSVKKWCEIEGASVIEIKSANQVRTIHIERYPILKTFLEGFPRIVAGLFFLITGFYALYKQPFSKLVHALFRLNWLIGFVNFLIPASARGLILGKELFLIGFALIPILLIDFISLFGQSQKNTFIKLSRHGLVILPVFLVIVSILKLAGAPISAQLFQIPALINVAIGIFLALTILINAIKTPANPAKKNQLLFIISGLFVGLFPVILLSILPRLLGTEPLLYPRTTGLFIVILPVTMLYATLSPYLPNARKMMRVFTEVVASAALITVGLALAWPYKPEPKDTVHLYIQLFIFAVVLFFLISGLKFLLEKPWSRLHALFGRSESAPQREGTIIQSEGEILEDLRKNLGLEGTIAIIETGKNLRREAAGRFAANLLEQKILEDYYLEVRDSAGPGKILPHNYPAEIAMFFSSGDTRMGLFLGYSQTKIRFNRLDLPIALATGYQVFQRLLICPVLRTLQEQIKKAKKETRKIRKKFYFGYTIKRLIFRNVEKEKEILAREVHDGPLQAGLWLKRELNNVDEYLKGSHKDDEYLTNIFAQMSENIGEINFELRNVCNNLRPSIVKDLGPIPAITAFVSDMMRTELININLEIHNLPQEQRFGEEIDLAVFRFVQEGIRNVLKHSGSQQAEVRLSRTSRGLEVEVKDFGCGFDADFILDNPLDDHFGIIGMRERIESLGGSFSVKSRPQEGTVFRGVLPIVC